MVTVWEYTPGDVFLSMLWFFLFFIWIWLLITVFADIFRSDDLNGWTKALWTVAVILFPYLGVFVYLIARGKKMGENQMRSMEMRDQAMRSYVRDAAGTPSTAGEIERLAALQTNGAISMEEYQAAKAKLLA